ncbi:hypothetical protein AB0L57_26770 [Nocardia sp. NPDC052254]
MSEPVSVSSALRRVGVDWWAVIVAGLFVTLALGDVLPKIPW